MLLRLLPVKSASLLSLSPREEKGGKGRRKGERREKEEERRGGREKGGGKGGDGKRKVERERATEERRGREREEESDGSKIQYTCTCMYMKNHLYKPNTMTRKKERRKEKRDGKREKNSLKKQWLEGTYLCLHFQ